ncbi:MAG: energy-coupling factor transporter transmembrane protein EcfT [Calditrichaeota bacterium]|nr:MAG: energy-coupling factor transporter transmembrane protein EcfT [Calditrichota bacterium]
MFKKQQIILGHYRPIDSFYHNLDTLAKLFPIIVLLIVTIISDSMLFYSVLFTIVFLSLLFSGVDKSLLLRNFKPIMIFILITSLYHLLFSGKESEILFDIGSFKLYSGAVYSAAFYSLRLLLFIASAFILTLTSSPSQLGDAAAKVLKPFEIFKLPVQDLVLIIFIALRFIPILYDEFISIKNAQIIRGVDFSSSLITRIKKISAIIIPVFLAAIHRADELALALQVRGYGVTKKRTYYSAEKFQGMDFLFLTGSSVFIIGLYYFIG